MLSPYCHLILKPGGTLGEENGEWWISLSGGKRRWCPVAPVTEAVLLLAGWKTASVSRVETPCCGTPVCLHPLPGDSV